MSATGDSAVCGDRPLVSPMVARSPDEQHRASTPLELFFDLVFVVAIAQAAEGLHHAVAEAHVADAILSYVMVFFSIWWAWMNFTWFASAYDTDDVPYRLVVLVQLTGALILAAGVSPAFEEGEFRMVAVGFVVMRVAMVTQWLRASRSDRARRTTARRYAAGISVCQVCWVGLVFARADWLLWGFFVLAAAELAVPVWAERAGLTPWHREHIVERYGLFTIIVLGETILAASVAIRGALQGGTVAADLLSITVGGVLLVFALWWLYFAHAEHATLSSFRSVFAWGYGHLAIFSAAAAVGAGIAVAVDHETGHTALGRYGAGAAVAVPVAIYLLCLWALHVRPGRDGLVRLLAMPLAAGLVMLTPLTGKAVLWTGLLMVGLLVIELANHHRSSRGA